MSIKRHAQDAAARLRPDGDTRSLLARHTMDWKDFLAAAADERVDQDTIDVFEAEGFDDSPEKLLNATTSQLSALRLTASEVQKTSRALGRFRKNTAGAAAAAAAAAASPAGDAKRIAAAGNATVTAIEKKAGELLANVSTTVAFILSTPEEKRGKITAAKACTDKIHPALQALSAAADSLPASRASVKAGSAQLIRAVNALMKVVSQIGGQSPPPQMRQYLDMAMEQFEGAVQFLKLATAGRLTDKPSTSLLAAIGKNVEDRLLDVVNACKRFKFNFSGSMMAEEQLKWQKSAQGTWVSGKGVIETLKHLSRLLMQPSSRGQLADSVKGARGMLTVVVSTAQTLDAKAAASSDIKQAVDALGEQLTALETAMGCVEGERAAGGGLSAAILRRSTREALASSLSLLSACQNVCVALPQLKALSAACDKAWAQVKLMLSLLQTAVKAPKSTPGHTALVRAAGPAGNSIDALAAAAAKAVPTVKTVGNTENLERRIAQVKGVFEPVAKPSSVKAKQMMAEK